MLLVGVMVSVLVGTVLATPQVAEAPDLNNGACERCHTCVRPTARDACLKPCFRHSALTQSGKHQVAEAPESILLDELTTKYLPILFDHKLHAEMAGMSDNCATCHHYSPEGEIPPCRSCHPKDQSPVNLAQPDLKTAYHRQCLVCHSQWAHEATCDVCHQPSKSGGDEGSNESRFVRGSFSLPTASVPVSKIYVTSHQSAPVVTFQHIEHIELFEYNCVDCHQHENCRYCHDQINREGLTKPLSQVHAICTGCHDINVDQPESAECGECHDQQKRPEQFHSIVGRTLPAYLAHKGCDGCHPDRSKAGESGKM
jgi:hypothetical protein